MRNLSKRYTNLGRDRFGSEIFINDAKENFVDSVDGRYRDKYIIIGLILLFLIKILSTNFIGLIIYVPLFYFLYFASEELYNVSFTNNRILITNEYNYPDLVRIFGLILLISGVFTVFVLINTPYFWHDLGNIQYLFTYMGMSNILLFQYSIFVRSFSDVLIVLDYLYTLVYCFWYGLKFIQIDYSFTEVNHSHITEQLIKQDQQKSFFSVSMFLFLYFGMVFILNVGIFVPLFLIIIIYNLIPRNNIAKFRLFGGSERPLLPEVEINPEQYNSLQRGTSAIFDYAYVENNEKKFPLSLVPTDSGNYYQTGLRASLLPALTQANNIGAIISMLINIGVIFYLSRLILPSQVDELIRLAIILFFFTIFFYATIQFVNYVRVNIQADEGLIITQNFVVRYVEPSIWLVKGDKLEGTSVQRGVKNQLFQYDKIRGLVIGWQRLSIIAFIFSIALVISIWSYLGGINLELVILNFPVLFGSVFNYSIDFFQSISPFTLGLVVFTGYFIWIILTGIYPTLFARTRPTLNLELQASTSPPIVLKNFQIHTEATQQFTKLLVNRARSSRRPTSGRPGYFELELTLDPINLPSSKTIELEYGEQQFHQLIKMDPKSMDLITIDSDLRVSALRGYPSIPIKITGENNSSFKEEINLLYTKSVQREIDIGKIKLRLSIEVIARKS